MSRIRHVPYIFEVRDLWPGIFIELGVLKNRYLIKLLESIEIFLYRRAAGVVPVTQGFADNITRRGIPSEKIEVITNGVDLDTYTPNIINYSLRKELNLPLDAFILLYIGAHGISHGLQSVIEAAYLLRHNVGIHFLFVGEGADKAKLISLAQKKTVGKCYLYERTTQRKGCSFLSFSRCMYCSIKKCSRFEYIYSIEDV